MSERTPVSSLADRLAFIAVFGSILCLAACGGATSSSTGSTTGSTTTGSTSTTTGSATPAPAVISVAMAPITPALRAGDQLRFGTSVTGTDQVGVTWSVNGVNGGSAATGTIDRTGLYIVPTVVPSPNTVTLTATSVADTSKSVSTTVTILNPIPAITSVTQASAAAGPLTLQIEGAGFAPNARVLVGGSPLSTTVNSSGHLTATAASTQPGLIYVSVVNPDPGTFTTAPIPITIVTSSSSVTYEAAVRFLEETTFGPTPGLIAHVQQVGFDNFLNEQFNTPASDFADPIPVDDLVQIQNQFMAHAVNGPDQLRQRVAFALEQIVVVSGNKISDGSGLANWLRLMQNDAFGNYGTAMKQFTLSPTMGLYLDMVNNDKSAGGTITANENYAREIMQLFSIGLNKLNVDGSVQLDGMGQPIPTYTQADVANLARVFTGWTYPVKPNATPRTHNPSYFVGPMVPVESNHDTGAKTILNNTSIPAGQSAEQDLDLAVNTIFNHPNVGPFICKQMILHLAKSNPTPAYVERVVNVFNDNGVGIRGDMRSVVKAILLDPEVRTADTNPAAALDGHLREPVMYVVGLMRALTASSDGTALVVPAANMGQNILIPATVFNYYHPDFVIPNTTDVGPEFQIHSPATATERANFVNSVVFGSLAGTTIDYSSWQTLAADPNALLDALNHLFMHGQMSQQVHDSILTAVNAVPASQPLTRAKQAIYLVASSSQYQVAY